MLALRRSLGLQLDAENQKDASNWRAQQRRLQSGFLDKNFAPVDGDASHKQLEVIGNLPEDFEGMFARAGPNPRFVSNLGCNFFDGDGMVHNVLFKDGTASYARHQVRTPRYLSEQRAKKATYSRVSDFKGYNGLQAVLLEVIRSKLGIIRTDPGYRTTANTALEVHAGRLLALAEFDVPFGLRVMCDGLLETIGAMHFEGRLNSPFTAHPKIDPEDGCMYAFGYNVERAPYVTYHVVDETGQLTRSVPINIPNPVMMHDFAITRQYVIFMDHPLIFNIEAMIRNNTVPFVFDETRASRFGIIAKNAETDTTRWFELPSCFAFHIMNAWEEGEEFVYVVACADNRFEFEVLEDMDCHDFAPSPTLYTLNLITGQISSRRLVPEVGAGLEFPRVPSTLIGRPTRYGYCAKFTAQEKGVSVATAVVKLDLHSQAEDVTAATISFGAGRFGGECVFVPRHANPELCNGEDDGFLITFIYDSGSNTSEVVTYDAKTMSEEPVFRVLLPDRVPYGFHGMWIDKRNLSRLAHQKRAEEVKSDVM